MGLLVWMTNLEMGGSAVEEEIVSPTYPDETTWPRVGEAAQTFQREEDSTELYKRT